MRTPSTGAGARGNDTSLGSDVSVSTKPRAPNQARPLVPRAAQAEITIPFTYSDLPASVAAELDVVTTRIKDRLTRQVSDIIETGRDLLDVKSKLDHGQFESWLSNEFNMTDRTARRFMQAATWAEGKTDTVSVLMPTAVYLLSAKSTPDVVQEQVVERIEKGLPAEPEMIRHLIKDAKYREREAKNRKGKREARDARKRREDQPEEIKNLRERERADARTEKQRVKKEETEKRTLAANFITQAQTLVWMLVDDPKFNVRPLAEKTEGEIDQTLRNFDILYKRLRKALLEAHQLRADNVTLFPPKPWAKS